MKITKSRIKQIIKEELVDPDDWSAQFDTPLYAIRDEIQNRARDAMRDAMRDIAKRELKGKIKPDELRSRLQDIEAALAGPRGIIEVELEEDLMDALLPITKRFMDAIDAAKRK